MTHPNGPARRALALAACALPALVLAACAPGAAPRAEGVRGTASDTRLNAAWQERTHARFYEQSIEWRPCTAKDGLDEELTPLLDQSGVDASSFECGSATAPLDWSTPADERTISLALVRIPSSGDSERATPLFTNPGGPGVGGVQHAMLMTTTPSFQDVLATHELWGFDPRGIGRSTPASCASDSEIGAVQVAECAKDNPIAHSMGTSQVARDMELLRALSGAPRLDYLGYSYGTMLGATYATLFPDKAGRMVLDSAENAQWASLEHAYDQQVAVAAAAGRLADSCPALVTEEGKAVDCPFTSERTMLDFMAALDETPLVAHDGTQIRTPDIRAYLTSALYTYPGGQAASLDRLGKAAKGDEDAINALAEEIAAGGAEIDTAGQLAVCPSSPKSPDIAGLVEHIHDVGVPEFIGGPELSDEVLSQFTEFDCVGLEETGTDFTTRFDASTVTTPLLVIGITGDHATPYAHGKELAAQLGRAVFLTLEGTGHGASFSERSACVDRIASAYLNEGALPEPGTVCTEGA